MIWGLLPWAMQQLKELMTTTPASLQCRVSFLLPESLVVQQSSPSMISPALSSSMTQRIIFQANTCAQSLKSLPLMPFILMCPPQMVVQQFQISKYTRDEHSTGTSPHQVPTVQEGISFTPSPVHLLHGIEHGTLSVPLSLLCRRIFTVSNFPLVFS
jgi:hypothetical protein